MYRDAADVAEANAEKSNDAYEDAKAKFLDDSSEVCIKIMGQVADDYDYGHAEAALELRTRYAEVASILYQLRDVFASLNAGKTMEKIMAKRDIQDWRILMEIAGDCDQMIQRCVDDEMGEQGFF